MSLYRIEGPALLSISGGRTSAFMLAKILEAHGGALPPDVIPIFANTGKEREETLRFVYDLGARWGVHIRWVEWRTDGTHYGTFEEVGFNSASRAGEPFDALIDHKQMPPNWRTRFCTEFLKVRAMLAAMEAWTGLKPPAFKEIIGLRQDEPERIFRMIERNDTEKRACVAPLAGINGQDPAGVKKAEVMEFWLGRTMRMDAGDRPQGFDLGLEPWEGNCDLCFLKGRKLRKALIRARPASATWWAAAEERAEGFFDRRDQYRDLKAEALAQGDLFEGIDPEEYDVECGLICGAS